MTSMAVTLGARGLTQPPQANGASIEAKMGAEFGWDQRVFPLMQDRQIDWTQRIPSSWDGGPISIYVRCRTPSIVNDCIFELHYEIINVGVDRALLATPVPFDAQMTTTVPGTADEDFQILFTDTPAVSPGDLVKFRLKRLGTLPGDSTGDINVTEAWLEYKTVPKLRGSQVVSVTGPITKNQFQNSLTRLDTSLASVNAELPSLLAADDLTGGWFVREGGALAQLSVPVGYNLIYLGGTVSPYDLATDGQMVYVLYLNATNTFYIK